VIAYDELKAHKFAPVVQSYTARDCRLYALGLNIGANPLDADALRYVAADPPAVVCTMPMTLARPGAWMRDAKLGIDYRRVVVGEVTLRLRAPLPAEATVRGEHRIVRVTDKGEGRGALVTVERQLTDTATGQLLAEYEQVTFCRGDGGFATDGRHDAPPEAPPWEVPEPAADWTVDLPTAPQQALIFRLSGDMNPLHSDPEVARRAGFDRPILHGLSTMGMVGHALDRMSFAAGGAPLHGLTARLAAPVFPGEQLRLEVWRDGNNALFRTINGDGREVVAQGRAEFQKMD
jgi:acyl dehydratase